MDYQQERHSSLVRHLTNQELIKPPRWLAPNMCYETVMGSQAYGVSTDDSDFDIYGFCVPPKTLVFPHLAGEIPGFGRQVKRFEQFQVHHVIDADAAGGHGREYDLQIFSIVKYFQLLMDNNPNMIDSLFTPLDAVVACTQVGHLVREKRHLFLHKGAWHKFKGYAYAQLHKIETKNPEGKRKEIIEKFGFDVKFAYHLVRLINEVEQILVEGDLDLRRNSEQLKSIRRGDWTLEDVRNYFVEKERYLERIYAESKALPHSPDEQAIKNLLLECLEHHYGNLQDAVVVEGRELAALREIRRILDGVGLN